MVVRNALPTALLAPFPKRFVLRDLVALTAPVFELKSSPFQDEADKATREWFAGCVHHPRPCSKSAP